MGDNDAGARVPVNFDLGRVCATPGAMRAIEEAGQTPGDFLQRHLGGDWGEEDRIFSAYKLRDGVSKIWVITEWNRSSTTILTPDEY